MIILTLRSFERRSATGQEIVVWSLMIIGIHFPSVRSSYRLDESHEEARSQKSEKVLSFLNRSPDAQFAFAVLLRFISTPSFQWKDWHRRESEMVCLITFDYRGWRILDNWNSDSLERIDRIHLEVHTWVQKSNQPWPKFVVEIVLKQQTRMICPIDFNTSKR